MLIYSLLFQIRDKQYLIFKESKGFGVYKSLEEVLSEFNYESCNGQACSGKNEDALSQAISTLSRFKPIIIGISKEKALETIIKGLYPNGQAVICPSLKIKSKDICLFKMIPEFVHQFEVQYNAIDFFGIQLTRIPKKTGENPNQSNGQFIHV